tara:strand:+ start:237 stop:554 length:318 start_codon:yes stop_codon:yes gene_type:complete
MDLPRASNASKAQIRHQIMECANSTVATRQVAKRLKDFIPIHLQRIKKEYQAKGVSASKATRQALLDKRYLDKIKQLADLLNKSLHSRVQWEVLSMYYNVINQRK